MNPEGCEAETGGLVIRLDDLARVLALLEELGLQDAVVCTHGEVIEQVRPGWSPTGGGRPAVGVAKGSIWLLDGANGRFTHARHLSPLSLGPGSERGIGTWGGGTATPPRKVPGI